MSLIQNEDCSLPYPKAALMAVAIDSKCDRFAQSVSPRLSKLMRLCVYDFKNSTTPRLRWLSIGVCISRILACF